VPCLILLSPTKFSPPRCAFHFPARVFHRPSNVLITFALPSSSRASSLASPLFSVYRFVLTLNFFAGSVLAFLVHHVHFSPSSLSPTPSSSPSCSFHLFSFSFLFVSIHSPSPSPPPSPRHLLPLLLLLLLLLLLHLPFFFFFFFSLIFAPLCRFRRVKFPLRLPLHAKFDSPIRGKTFARLPEILASLGLIAFNLVSVTIFAFHGCPTRCVSFAMPYHSSFLKTISFPNSTMAIISNLAFRSERTETSKLFAQLQCIRCRDGSSMICTGVLVGTHPYVCIRMGE